MGSQRPRKGLQALVAVQTCRALAADGIARALREDAGLSLGEVGEALGVSASTVMHWERGEQKPKGDRARRYAALLEALGRLTDDVERGEPRALGSPR